MKIDEKEKKRIIEMILKGYTNVEISAHMGYSPASVKRRLKEIYKSYNVENRIGLVTKQVTGVMAQKLLFNK